MTVCRFVTMLVILLVSTLIFADSVDQGSEEPALFAQWTGGGLSRSEFVSLSDPDETLLRSGGADLTKAVCKASFRSIYGSVARSKGLDHDPEFLEEMRLWRRSRLASLYIERSRSAYEPTFQEARAFYGENVEKLYSASGAADLEILFVRCENDTRDLCLDQLKGLRARFDDGEDFRTLINEEKLRSGEANGVFHKVPLNRLALQLAEAVRTTPDGWLTPVVDTPRGLFLIRVSNFVAGSNIPFERAERHVRQVMRQEREAAWIKAETARLREEPLLDFLTDASDDEVFAAAARSANLHLEAVFLQSDRAHHAWALADFAFFRDAEMLPSDEEIFRRLREESAIISRYEQREFILVVVAAGSDRNITLDVADRVRQLLQTAEEPKAAVENLLKENENLIVIELAAVTRSELSKVKPSITDEVFVLDAGQWGGPFAFRTGFSVPEELIRSGVETEVPAGIGFVIATGVQMPEVDQVRQKFYREARDAITAPGPFIEAMKQRWDLEIFVEVER